jgi:cleavage and polyadenylation specificity factor subunit 1
MLVTTTGLLHVDQGGRVVCVSVNAWWGYTTSRISDRSYESRQLSLEGSRASFVGDRDMLLVLATGQAHQIRMEMDGRAVGSIIVEEEVGVLPPPSSISRLGKDKVIVGSAEGDSVMYEIQMIREKVDQGEDKKPAIDMELDYDDGTFSPSPVTILTEYRSICRCCTC